MIITINTLTESSRGLDAGTMRFSFTDANGRRFSGNTYRAGNEVCVHAVEHVVVHDDGAKYDDFHTAHALCRTLDPNAADMENELRDALIEWHTAA